MARKQKATRLRQMTKTVLRRPGLDQAKSAVLNSLSSQMPNAVTVTPLTSSSSDTVPSRGTASTVL